LGVFFAVIERDKAAGRMRLAALSLVPERWGKREVSPLDGGEGDEVVVIG
jgi:hypothetical protein